MDFSIELLSHILANGEVQVTFPQLTEPFSKLIEGECYKALCKIKTIVEDDSLEDSECFQKIEEIVSAFEALGSNGGNRHDFG